MPPLRARKGHNYRNRDEGKKKEILQKLYKQQKKKVKYCCPNISKKTNWGAP